MHLIEVNGGPHTEFLVGAGCVDIWESCWVGHELYGKYGAHPTGMFGRYDVDGAFLKDFYAKTRSQEGFDAFAKEWIHGHDHLSYLEKLGWGRMLDLKANTALNYSTSVKRGQ